MEFRDLGLTKISTSLVMFGTWAFGGDTWWGKQEDADSLAALSEAIDKGVNSIDTAPVYGRGRSERLIGAYIRKRKIRDTIILATKVGLNWQGARIYHDLSRQRMLEEFDQSRQRLDTDYFDLYQVHWPDPDTPIAQTAAFMNDLYQKQAIKSIGVSNYSLSQIKEFMRYSPLHCLQPEYSMFNRSIEAAIVPFCLANNISIISYAPLYSGLLSGKFFLDNVCVPSDKNRKMKRKHFQEPLFSINKAALLDLKILADFYGKSLSQLAINWNFSQAGITAAIVGMRNVQQVRDNLGSCGWKLSAGDNEKIQNILKQRLEAASGNL